MNPDRPQTTESDHEPLEVRIRPELRAASAWIAPTATVVGNVHLGEQSSVWFGAVVRGDCESVTIGPRTNVQDLACLHADPGLPCVVGANVTIGHAAIVHGATVEDDCLIGIRATVLNGARVGRGSLIGAAALVTENAVIPPNSLVLGVPGKVVPADATLTQSAFGGVAPIMWPLLPRSAPKKRTHHQNRQTPESTDKEVQ